jgi:nucleoside-diphosphate-sugar epimerase
LARRELGWSPKVEITDGLDEAIGLNTSFR